MMQVLNLISNDILYQILQHLYNVNVFQGTKNPSYGCYHESNIQKTAVTKGQ